MPLSHGVGADLARMGRGLLAVLDRGRNRVITLTVASILMPGAGHLALRGTTARIGAACAGLSLGLAAADAPIRVLMIHHGEAAWNLHLLWEVLVLGLVGGALLDLILRHRPALAAAPTGSAARGLGLAAAFTGAVLVVGWAMERVTEAPEIEVWRMRPSDSWPSFPSSGRVVVLRDAFAARSARVGDLVWLRAEDLGADFAAWAGIQRVIALPGDRLGFEDGWPRLNGEPAAYEAVPDGRGGREDRLVRERLRPGDAWHLVSVATFNVLERAGTTADCEVPPGAVATLRDARWRREAIDSRSYMRQPRGLPCPTFLPVSMVRHMPPTA